MSEPVTPAASAAPAAPSNTPAPQASADAALEAITPEEQAELDAEAKPGDPLKPAAPSEAKIKVKIDGEEVELTDAELKKYASLGKAAQKRMEEAAVIRKQHESFQKDVNTFLEMLQKDPARVLGDIGVDPQKFAEELINKKIEEAGKTPEQKEKDDLISKLEEANKKLKDTEDGKKKEERERMTNEAATRLERDINNAIESGNMPKHPVMIRKVADLMMLAAAQNINLEAPDVIPIAKQQIIDEFKELTAVLPEELLEEILGTDKVASLRRRYLKKLKPVPTTPKDIKSTGADTKSKEEKAQQSQKARDFFKKLGTF